MNKHKSDYVLRRIGIAIVLGVAVYVIVTLMFPNGF